MKKVSFFKMQGSGNDFILIDNRRGVLNGKNLREVARKVCHRHYSVGADGLIVIVPARKADFKWRFFNADGSEAEMCGNGSRCAARFAFIKKIARKNMTFETRAGLIHAVVGKSSVNVQLTGATALCLNITVPLKGGSRVGHFINTGVPHTVYLSEALEAENVMEVGRSTRYHDMFKPAGTNVNFIQVAGKNKIGIRTYERGVEGETLACGTGAVAGALIAEALGMVSSPVQMVTKSREKLIVSFKRSGGEFSNLRLEGGAQVLCEGSVYLP